MSRRARTRISGRAGCAIAVAFLSINQSQRALALDPSKLLSQYATDTWRTDDGLPEAAVQAIAQTPDGYIWFGTQDGLARFDGVRFTIFDASNTPSITHDFISALCVDRNGALWIGTLNGLIRYDKGIWRTYAVKEGMPGSKVTCTYADSSGGLWVGFAGGPLARFADGKFKAFTKRDGFVGRTPWAMIEDRDKNIWIGTEAGGLCRYRDGAFRTFTRADGLSDDSITSLCMGRAGELWIGTLNGLTRMHRGAFEVFHTRDGLPDAVVNALARDRDGGIWIGTVSRGVCRYAGGEFETPAQAGDLSDRTTLSFLDDREGSLWIGAAGTGVVRLRDTAFTAIGPPEGIEIREAMAVLQARSGSMWASGSNGVFELTPSGRSKQYSTRDGLSYDYANAICEDRLGGIWIGTFGGGLCRLFENRFTQYSTADGLTHNTIAALCADTKGGIWIGTIGGGVSKFEESRITPVRIGDLTGDTTVHSIVESKNGALWFGRQDGLVCLEGERTRRFTREDGLSVHHILSLYEDMTGVLWIGTLGGGLNKFANGVFTPFRRRDGLLDDTVYSILEDAAGLLWLSGSRGVCAVSKNALRDFASGQSSRIDCRKFTQADGIRGECNGGSPAGFKAADGRLWFASTDALIVVDPSRLPVNSVPATARIEDVSVDGHPIALDGTARLSPAGRRLELRFTAPSLLVPERVRFRCKLEGFDAEWIDNGTNRTLSYTNLPPGRYRFRVIACNSDGVWDESGASYAFEVEPRFYQTFGFLTLSAVLITFTGVALSLWHSLAGFRREKETQTRIHEALERARKLEGLLPICASCKSIETDTGEWTSIETYLRQHSDLDFNFRLCPCCIREAYPDLVGGIALDT